MRRAGGTAEKRFGVPKPIFERLFLTQHQCARFQRGETKVTNVLLTKERTERIFQQADVRTVTERAVSFHLSIEFVRAIETDRHHHIRKDLRRSELLKNASRGKNLFFTQHLIEFLITVG